MAQWPVREKRPTVMIVEQLEEQTRQPKAADPPSPRLRRASWRPPLLVVKRRLREILLSAALPRAGLARRA